jgi:hypothetical protein
VRRESGAYSLAGAPVASYREFADQVHDRLCTIDSSDPDFLVLETFAWVVIEVERRQSTSWAGANPQDFADAVEAALGKKETSGERRFNSTKLAPWRRWTTFMGLGLDLPGNTGFYPYIAERLARELARSELPTETDLLVSEVLAVIGRKMPYMDGGVIFSRVATRVQFQLPARRVSRLLSIALRDLHDEGRISLQIRGDSSDRFELAPDGQHAIKAVQTIRLTGQSS